MRALEILWIVLFRFNAIPRAWAICLILVNLASIFFLDTFYAWLNLIAVGFGIFTMIVIYLRLGFVRLLGVGHFLWIPMIAYFVVNMPTKDADPSLYWWLVFLIGFNSVSLVIDAIDVARFWKGDCLPHYTW